MFEFNYKKNTNYEKVIRVVIKCYKFISIGGGLVVNKLPVSLPN